MNRRRGGCADDGTWVTSVAGRRRSLVAERGRREDAPKITTAEDISSRDCRSITVTERQRSRRRRRKPSALIGGGVANRSMRDPTAWRYLAAPTRLLTLQQTHGSVYGKLDLAIPFTIALKRETFHERIQSVRALQL